VYKKSAPDKMFCPSFLPLTRGCSTIKIGKDKISYGENTVLMFLHEALCYRVC